MRWHFMLIVVLCLACEAATADAPPPPPSLRTVCNSPRTHCATSDPVSRKTTLVSRVSGEALWSLDGYHRYFEVSNDGRTILLLSDYANLAPLNATNVHVLFTIYRDGRLIQSVLLGALFESPAKLQRTTSHLSWGQLEKIDVKDNAVFTLVDGRIVAYSLVTGRRDLDVAGK